MAKILVIDDERSIRNVMKEVLELEQHKVTCAEDGFKGLDCLKNEKFDLVFSDIKMEGIDGIEVLEKIKELYPEVSVVMISGHGKI